MFRIAKDETVPLPPCYVRIDVAHLIKNTADCDALKGVQKKVRDFYIRCVGQLVLTDNFVDAQILIKCILTVANSATEGNLSEIYKINSHNQPIEFTRQVPA